jgi:hypothetical protein
VHIRDLLLTTSIRQTTPSKVGKEEEAKKKKRRKRREGRIETRKLEV